MSLLPLEYDFNKEFENASQFNQNDPSKSYEIIVKIGYGRHSRAFLVKSKNDGKKYVLKFIEPRNPKEREMFKNDLGLMKICGKNENII